MELAGDVREGDTHASTAACCSPCAIPPTSPIPSGRHGWRRRRGTSPGSACAILTIVTGVTWVYLMMAGKRGAALLVLVAVIGGTLLSSGLKLGFERPRPDLVPHAAGLHRELSQRPRPLSAVRS